MRLLIASLLLLSCGVALAVGQIDFKNLPIKINEYLNSKIMTPEMEKTFELFRQRKTMKPYTSTFDMPLLDGLDEKEISKAVCDTCTLMVDTIFSWIDAGDTRQQIIDKYVTLCTDTNFASPNVCRATAEIRFDLGYWLYTTKNGTQYPITAQDVCGFNYFADCWVGGPQYEWTLDLNFLGPKPTPDTPQLPEPSSPTLKVLQFTDIHIDPNYLVGGNAECEDLNCCRFDQGAPANSSAAAGYWGDYRDCDTPYHAFENMLQQAATHTDIAYIIFTGDIIDHGTWATSTSTNRDSIIYAFTSMVNYFPNAVILPIVGNHESHPTHNFVSDLPEVPASISTGWLYSIAEYIWSAWIPNARETILKGGFYSYQVNPGLKVIGLNNIFCYNYNWWLLYENEDPAGQLIWFAQELLASEQQNQKVHVLAHIPSSSDCMPNWQKEYLRILDRFENTIVAMFHGHTHNEHFNIYYDPNNRTRATGVGFIGGSGTAFSNVNPNYRIYTIDGDYQGSSYRVLDHETWSFNLTEANLNGPDVPPTWTQLYSFKDAFGLSSLLPQDLDAFVSRLANDANLQDLYYRLYWTAGDPSLAATCDVACRRNLVCEIVRNLQGDDSKCADFLP
ncbi:sphingomyelin phosphodiesterase-like [Neocloeon triangulifer]|uniref:sphingomyelin phosphodiesterase-like n=1 Tax=Neocloeon triangulifer TaxID=2078957 RepID=UPI00286F39B6|nr:sphingomyelin phosphodiesterase-like [Neocloeon triangulifer]